MSEKSEVQNLRLSDTLTVRFSEYSDQV